VDSKKRKEDERGVFLGTGASDAPTPASLVAPHLVNVGKSVPQPKPRRSTDDLETEERARGNDFFKNGDYESAKKCYTRCLGINSRSGVAFSNRAMAYLKLKEFQLAEKDATSALSIDPGHVKSYQRRSSARGSLGKLRAALKDLKTAAQLDCGGKALAVEIRKATEALRDAVKRAPKKRIQVKVVSGAQRQQQQSLDSVQEKGDEGEEEEEGEKEDEDEEEQVLEIGEDGFDISSAGGSSKKEDLDKPPPPPPAAKSGKGGGKIKKQKAPKTQYEFEKTWRGLKGAGEKEKYLFESVDSLAKLLKTGFPDATMFENVLEVLAGYSGDKGKLGEKLSDLAKVKSVDMLCMMATDKGVIERTARKAFGDTVPERVKKSFLL